jgi:hypothetical protein
LDESRHVILQEAGLNGLRRKDLGGRRDKADAEWIVIRRPVSGHNNSPFGRPTPGRLIGRPGVGHPQGVFGVLIYH